MARMPDAPSPYGPLDLLQLRYFQAIARSGSITKAAALVGASQPTLTVALRNLEERLGTTLFLRDRRGMVLTDTGRVAFRVFFGTELCGAVEQGPGGRARGNGPQADQYEGSS